MADFLNNNTLMTWVLILSVYMMFCALGWRSTSPNKPPRRSYNRHWSLPVLLVAPFLLVMCLPSMLTVALIRLALSNRRIPKI